MRSWEAESGFPLGFISIQRLYWGKCVPSSLWSLAKCRDLKLWVLVAPRLQAGPRTAVTHACWPPRQDHFTESAGGISLGLASKINLYSCVPTCIYMDVYPCLCVYLCVSICTCAFTHRSMQQACMLYVCMQIDVYHINIYHLYRYICMSMCMHMSTCVNVCRYVSTCAYVCTYVLYVCLYKHVYIFYISMNICICLWI